MRSPIMVMESEPSSRELLKTFLQLDGYEVVIATSAEDALNKMHTFHPTLVLIHARGEDGLEVIRAIKSDYKHIQVVALTTHILASEEATLRQTGVDGVLPMPINRQQLQAYMAHSI